MITRRLLLFCVFIFLLSPVFAQDQESLYKEGVALHDKGEYAKAIEKYKEAIQLAPNSGTLYYEMAYSYHALKDYENAITSVDKAIQLSEGQTKSLALVVKGSILDDSGKPKEAVSFYEKTLRDYPDDYLLWFNYAITCRRLGKEDEAEKALIKAVTIQPLHPGSNLQLAYIKKLRNEKVKSMLGLYFFLLLENNTPRAETAFTQLIDLTALEQKESRNISIVLSDSKDTQGSAAELIVALLATTVNEISKTTNDGKVGSLSSRFILYTEKFFKVTREQTESKNAKKKKDNPQDHWNTFYTPFFSELQNAGHLEAFCHHIMLASGNEDSKEWLETNREKRELFYFWLEKR